MHTVIVGAGALGSILGGYMTESGEAVTLVGRKSHVDAIRADGLIIEGMRGRHVVRAFAGFQVSDLSFAQNQP